jgi:uncharacterized protein YecA (UPF0149 family)
MGSSLGEPANWKEAPVMDFSHVRRNDPCPCGSGKKFKTCHMGREDKILEDRMKFETSELALKIRDLPPAKHAGAEEMAGKLEFTSKAGKKIKIKLVDLDAYRAISMKSADAAPQGPGGLLINPYKTRVLDPTHIYVALTPDVNQSTVIHEFAHAADLIEGSALTPGFGSALSNETSIPVEILEHPQEFGERLVQLSEKFGVELDAEDEIVAYLAKKNKLLPGKVIAKGQKEELVPLAEKTMRFMQDSQEEINKIIKKRPGYMGDQKAS